MSNIFLTGATGFVGSFVAEKLAEQGHRVTCLVRKSSNLRWIKDLPVRFLNADIFDPATFKDTLKNAEYVLHVAGVTKAANPDDFYHGNVEATKVLAEAAITHCPNLERFLVVSSQAAVGPSPGTDSVDEAHPFHPLTDYGKSKMECELFLQSLSGKFPVTIIRPPSVYGPRDTDIYHFFKNMKYRVNLQVGNIDQLISLVYVEDLAAGIIQAAFSPASAGKTYFLCEDKPYRWSQMAELTSQIMGHGYMTLRIPFSLVKLIAGGLESVSKIRNKPTILNRQKMEEIRQSNWSISSRRAQQDFDYRTQYPLPTGLKKTIGWYRENGWL